MSSTITFTDELGTVTFSNDLPAPGDRFNGWTPLSPVAGAEAEALGTGEGFIYEYRADYGASFTISEIPQSRVADAMRLIRYLNRFGEVTVATGDAELNTYTCKKWKGQEPELSKPDRQRLTRTLTLTLKNTVAADMLVVWP